MKTLSGKQKILIVQGYSILEITEDRLWHSSKADSAILLTSLPMVIEVRLEQPEKACSPMVFTELLIVNDVRPLQPEFLQLIVCQLDLVKTVEKCLRRFCGGQKSGRFNVFNFL